MCLIIKMLWREIEGEKKKKLLIKTVERIRELPASDLFHEFKVDNPIITVSLKEFMEFYDRVEGELEW